MKQLICTLAVLLIAASVSNGQYKRGDLEAQFAVGFGSYSYKTTSTFAGSSQEHTDTYKHAEFILCPGYYIIDGLSIELELVVLAVEKEKPSQSFLANLSYTYPIPQTMVAPFVHAGYGVTNGFRFPGFIMVGMNDVSDKLDINVLNLGAGAKFLLTKHSAIVAEINYRGYSYSKTSGNAPYQYTTDLKFSNIGLLCGLSIIL
jgi:hypothetical protein